MHSTALEWLKKLPPDIKQGFERLSKDESDAGAKRMLGTMVRNIAVAEQTDNLLCQDTGIPIYNVAIGRNVEVDGAGLKEAIRRGCARSTREYSFRSSIVHPTTRVNEQTSTGRGIPVINIDFVAQPEILSIEMVPKGSVAVDGVSLTLVDVTADRFSVALIPHTLAQTTLGFKQPGASVNLETDVLAKYVWKCLRGGSVTRDTLHRAGFV